MITSNDTLFCTVLACERGISLKRLTYSMYLFQLGHFDFDFRYKLTSGLVKSKGVSELVNSYLNNGILNTDSSNNLITSELGFTCLNQLPLCQSEVDFTNYILGILNDLTTEELHFIVLTDILINKTKQAYGVDSLVSKRSSIEDTLKELTTEFTTDNFNGAVALLSKIKEGVLNYER